VVEEGTDWLAVIGKSLARMCLAQDVRATIAEKAKLLEGLGLSRREVAEILGTSSASVTELLRQAKKKKGGSTARARKKRK